MAVQSGRWGRLVGDVCGGVGGGCRNWDFVWGGRIDLAIYLAYQSARIPPSVKTALSKAGPLVIVIFGIFLVWFGRLDVSAGVGIVGAVPGGLPSFSIPSFDLQTLSSLLPAAITISLVGYMESVSVAKSLASKRREKIDPNQELIALGAANIGGAFTGGFPVTGGISRSVVNFSAGSRTGMASIVTAGLLVITLKS